MTTPISELSGNWPAAAASSERQRAERVIAQLTEPKPSEQNHAVPSQEELVEPIQQINEVFGKHGIQFDVNDQGSKVVVRIIDQDSGDVIRQIPSEEVLRIAERLDEVQGQLLNQQA